MVGSSILQSCSFFFVACSLVASSGKGILEAGKGWFLHLVFYPWRVGFPSPLAHLGILS